MKQAKQKKELQEDCTRRAAVEEPPTGVSLEKALLHVVVPATRIMVPEPADRETAIIRDNDNMTNTRNHLSEKQDEDMVLPCTALARCTLPLVCNGQAIQASSKPGAYHIPGRPEETSAAAIYAEQEEDDEERHPGSAFPTVDIECNDDQQQQQSIVSAYRVADEEPAIIATPLYENKIRIFIYRVLVAAAVIALIVGLSVGLIDKGKDRNVNPLGRLASSVQIAVTMDQQGAFPVLVPGMFVKAIRYIRSENGKEIATTLGSAVDNYCEVIPCIEGGCELIRKVYEPGCCRGNNCSPSDKCGRICPRRTDLCYPSFDGCTDASCYECERGPNGEELYRYRSASYNMNCLQTGVATGTNDKGDIVERTYKWAIVCGFNVQGGNEWQNYAPGEYMCAAVRTGGGITKTVSQVVPCQFIQLLECGCAPHDMHTYGLPPPDKSCKTKQDCPYLCGDAGEEEAKTLCEVFPGIEWWEGGNPTHQSLFYKPEDELFGNVSIEIEIYDG